MLAAVVQFGTALPSLKSTDCISKILRGSYQVLRCGYAAATAISETSASIKDPPI